MCGDLLYWSSPFALSSAVQEHLAAAGLTRFTEPLERLPPGSLLVYAQPHSLFGDLVDPDILLAGYGALREQAPAQRLIADWRLLTLEPGAIAGWVKGDHPCPSASGNPPMPADLMQRLFLKTLLESLPELLDRYLDLELQSELAQTPTDSLYAENILPSQDVDQLLNAWSTQQQRQHLLEQQQAQLVAQQEELKLRAEELSAAQAEGAAKAAQLQQLQEAFDHSQQERAAGAQQLLERQQLLDQQQAQLVAQQEELKLRAEELSAAQAEGAAKAAQLQQLQEELEQFFLANQQALERVSNLEGQVQKGEQLLADVREELNQRDVALKAAQEDGQEKSEQLLHVQEELEHYFHHNCGQAELIDQLAGQQKRALHLLKMVWVFWKGSIIKL